MRFYSTNNRDVRVSFEEALLRGLPEDYGLYTIPRESVPTLSKEAIHAQHGKSYSSIAQSVLFPYLSDDFAAEELQAILDDAYDPSIINAPLQHVTGKTHLLWLTKGPTLSFKDFAARFFGRTLNHFLKKRNKQRLVVVATSGDTGGAIADALHGLERVTCVVLYPKNDVSEVQRRQMTTLGGNVHAIAVNGDFDVCQALAKRLLNDTSFAAEYFGDAEHITSANSISLGRLLPQIVFPFWAYAHSRHDPNESFYTSIPSGNFGDMMGTVLAKHMGLPIDKILCGVNENVTFPHFLDTEKYVIEPTKKSPSSAMMVSHPSNVARLFDLYGGHIFDARTNGKITEAGIVDVLPDMNALKKTIFSKSISNAAHYETIASVYSKYGIVIEPHGAVGWNMLESFNPDHSVLSFVYETADPIKFAQDVIQSTGVIPVLPPHVAAQSTKAEVVSTIQEAPTRSPTGALTASDGQYEALRSLVSGFRS